MPPDLPEAALGITFAGDECKIRDWLSLVAVHGLHGCYQLPSIVVPDLVLIKLIGIVNPVTTLAVAGGGSASVKLGDTAQWQLIAMLSIPLVLKPQSPLTKVAIRNLSSQLPGALMEGRLLVVQWMAPSLYLM